MLSVMSQTPSTTTKKHHGSCHCGAVRYEVVLDLAKGVSRCNCTICTKVAATGALTKPDSFTLLSGKESLGTYEWGAKISKRHFCKHCGVHVYGAGHLAEIGGDFVSVNVNTLEDVELTALDVTHWDGRRNNWEAGARREPWPTLATTTHASANA